MASMKVKHRLTLGFGLMAAVIAVSMGVAVAQIRALRAGIKEISTVHIPRRHRREQCDRRAERQCARRPHHAVDRRSCLGQGPDGSGAGHRDADQLQHGATGEYPGQCQSMQLLDTIKAARVVYRANFNNFIDIFKSGKKDEARQNLLNVVRPSQLAYMGAVNQLINSKNRNRNQSPARPWRKPPAPTCCWKWRRRLLY